MWARTRMLQTFSIPIHVIQYVRFDLWNSIWPRRLRIEKYKEARHSTNGYLYNFAIVPNGAHPNLKYFLLGAKNVEKKLFLPPYKSGGCRRAVCLVYCCLAAIFFAQTHKLHIWVLFFECPANLLMLLRFFFVRRFQRLCLLKISLYASCTFWRSLIFSHAIFRRCQ